MPSWIDLPGKIPKPALFIRLGGRLEMNDEQFVAHSEDLVLAGREAREAAIHLANQVNQHLLACGAAGDHCQGFETRDAIYELTDAWAGHVRTQHVEHAHKIGQHYHVSGANYAGAEDASHRTVSAVRPV
jgi:hypothetical protein